MKARMLITKLELFRACKKEGNLELVELASRLVDTVNKLSKCSPTNDSIRHLKSTSLLYVRNLVSLFVANWLKLLFELEINLSHAHITVHLPFNQYIKNTISDDFTPKWARLNSSLKKRTKMRPIW